MRQKIPTGIFDLLHKDIELSRELLTLLAEEQAAIVAMDMSKLMALGRQKSESMERLRELDETLRQDVEELTGKPSEKAVRLLDLADLAAGEEQQRIHAMRRQLVDLRQQIAGKNVINRQFVRDTQRHLQEAISLITTAAGGEGAQNYGRPGRPGGMARRNSGGPSLISREV